MGRPVSPKALVELEKIIGKVHSWGAKFVLKGIMTPDEANLALEVGADAIVVSNHGGRVLDHTPAPPRSFRKCQILSRASSTCWWTVVFAPALTY